LDAFPAAEGHILVCPKQHYETLDQIPLSLSQPLFEAFLRISKAVTKLPGVKGYNLLQNNHPAAGQVVPHAHFHIVPRKEDDHLLHFPSSKSMIEKPQAEKMVQLVKQAMKD